MSSVMEFPEHVRPRRSRHDLILRNIKAAIAYFDVEQIDLAAAIGTTQANISLKLNGKRKLQIDELDIISEFFGWDVSELMREDFSPGQMAKKYPPQGLPEGDESGEWAFVGTSQTPANHDER